MVVLRAGDECGDSGGHASGKCSLVPGLLKVEVAGLADGVGMSPRDESKMTVRSSLVWLGGMVMAFSEGRVAEGEDMERISRRENRFLCFVYT